MVLGFDVSTLSPQSQYLVCAGGVFFFTLIYGFLQELVIVKIFDRNLSLFLALCQFWCYTVCSGVATILMGEGGIWAGGGVAGYDAAITTILTIPFLAPMTTALPADSLLLRRSPVPVLALQLFSADVRVSLSAKFREAMGGAEKGMLFPEQCSTTPGSED